MRHDLTVTTPAPSPSSGVRVTQFVADHLSLLVGGVPLALAVVRLTAVSQGDMAVMVALVQNLNLATILVFAVTTSVSSLLFLLLLMLAAGGSDRIPAAVLRLRPAFAMACIYLLVYVVFFVSWGTGLTYVGGGIAMVAIGLSFRRLERARGSEPTAAIATGSVLVVAVVALFNASPWLPADRITLQDGTVRVGYVLNPSDPNPSAPMTILWRQGGLVYLSPNEIKDRQPCNTTGTLGPGLLKIGQHSTQMCPLDK